MIIPVPMICDNSLKGEANTTIPLIAKAFERWILLHNIGKIKALVILSKHLRGIPTLPMRENTLTDRYLTYLEEVDRYLDQLRSDDDKDPVVPHVAANLSDFKLMESSLTKNPTWVKIIVKDKPRLVGVKVLPYFMNPNAKPINVIMQKDLARKFSKSLVISRKLLTALMIYARTVWRMLGVQFDVTGRASDVIWRATKFGVNTLCCFGELSSPNIQKIMSDQKNVRNLFMMGWSGFAIDMVSKKKVMFCTQHLKGTCATVSNAELHTAFDKANKRVYNSVDDLSKAFKL